MSCVRETLTLSSTSPGPLAHLRNAATARAIPAEWVGLGAAGAELQELFSHMLKLKSLVPKTHPCVEVPWDLGAGGRRGHTSIPTAPRLPGMPSTLSPLAGISPSLVELGRTCTEHLSHERLVLVSRAPQQRALLRAENLPVLRPSWPHQGTRGCPDRGCGGSRFSTHPCSCTLVWSIGCHRVLRDPKNSPRCL